MTRAAFTLTCTNFIQTVSVNVKKHLRSYWLILLYSFAEHDQTGLKWKSSVVKQSGIHVSPRCSASGILVQPNLAYIFGGVLDSEEDEEDLTGSFFNDLYALDLEKFQWKSVSLSGKKEGATARRRRRKEKGEGDENDEDSGEDETQEPMEVAPTEITDDDGIFTVLNSIYTLLKKKIVLHSVINLIFDR